MDIKPNYTHSKFGTFMFNCCAKWTKFIIKHRWLYYFLIFTWGLPVVLVGLIISFVLLIAKIFNHNIKFFKFCWIYGIKIGPDYWGGFSAGITFLRDKKSGDGINAHEFGHSIAQLSWMGIFALFLIYIPSIYRYWVRAIHPKKQFKPYDSFWGEDSATVCGRYATEFITQAPAKKSSND